MKNLSEIKTETLVLLDESNIDTVYEFLLKELTGVDDRLHHKFSHLKSMRNLHVYHKRQGFITTDEFIVAQNRGLYALKSLIEDLDQPFVGNNAKEDIFEKMYGSLVTTDSSKGGFLMLILCVQVLILIGIGILIYR